MRITLPTTCCCCFNLKTGGIIIGWIGMIFSILQITGASIAMHMSYVTPKAIYIGCSIVIAISVIYLLLNMALLWGSHKGQRFLLVPWLFTVGVLLFISIITVLVVGGIVSSGEHGHFGIGISVYAINLPILALQVYFWLCILSLFQKLREEEYAPADLSTINQVVVTTTNSFNDII